MPQSTNRLALAQHRDTPGSHHWRPARGQGTLPAFESGRIAPILPCGSNIKPLVDPKIALQHGWKLALVFICGIAPSPGLAYRAAFDGWLVNDNPSVPPVPIALSFEVNLAGVSGTVKTGPPQPGSGVLRGDEQFGTCDLRSDLGQLTLLRMKGGCGPIMSSFSGKYVLSFRGGRRQAGSFNLNKTNILGERASSGAGETARQPREFWTPTPARCIKANSSCLLACPRDDQSAELQCVSRCKQKLKACKEGTRGPVPEAAEPHQEDTSPMR